MVMMLKELKELKGLKKLKNLSTYTCVIPGRKNSPRARILIPVTQPDLVQRFGDSAPQSTTLLPNDAP